jgi:hypothetical protein
VFPKVEPPLFIQQLHCQMDHRDQPRQYTTHSQPYSFTRTSEIRPMCSYSRTPYTKPWNDQVLNVPEHAIKTYNGSRIVSHMLNLSTMWWCMIMQLLYPQYPLNWWLHVPHIQSQYIMEMRKISCPYPNKDILSSL